MHAAPVAGSWPDEVLAFLARPRGSVPDIASKVSGILSDVQAEGGSAVARLTRLHDGLDVDPQSLQAPEIDLARLAQDCPSDVRDAIDFAHDRIAAYHTRQLPTDHSFTDESGMTLGWRWTAIEAVGVYVPGGRASYPSSVLMNAVPARVAGVERVVMVAPAPKGQLNPAVAYAALKAGVNEYYPLGGAQAVAALAFGAGDLKPVHKIVGPGNAWVAEAKRQVFGQVGIDTIAGPSEICIVCDGSTPAAWIAADLLSQAEHDPSSQSILITQDADFARAVAAEVEAQLPLLATAQTARTSWQDLGALMVVPTLQDAVVLANKIAPEHLQLCVHEPEQWLTSIRHAGAVFLGDRTPEALGDYVTGSNHVLPTSGAARFSSGLGTLDFLKRMSVQSATNAAFDILGGPAHTLAMAEGLPAHARSISIRQSGAVGDE